MTSALFSANQVHLVYRQDCASRLHLTRHAEAALLTPSRRAGCAPQRGDARRFRVPRSVSVGKVMGKRATYSWVLCLGRG